jgi:hypothetical protein
MKKVKVVNKSIYIEKFNKGEVSAAVPGNGDLSIAIDLRGCHGKKFRGSIYGEKCEGAIVEEDGMIFLCQNIRNGCECDEKMGFRFSWIVQGKNIEVSRKILIDKIGNSKWKIAFKTPQKSFC